MSNLNKCMIRPVGTPDEWICNVTKVQASEVLSDEGSRVTVGQPVAVGSITKTQLETDGYVGIYSRKPDFFIPCSECGEDIPVTDSAHVAAVRSGRCTLYHSGCFPEKLEYTAPYVLKDAFPMEAKNENPTAGTEDIRGENGSGTEEERLSGRLEGSESGNGNGKTVG